jgi:hypothetical protein
MCNLKFQTKGNDAPGTQIAGDLIVAIEEVEHDQNVKAKIFIMTYM